MALTHGEKMALYLLLSSGSDLRLELDGKNLQNDPPQTWADGNTLAGALQGALKDRGWVAASGALVANEIDLNAVANNLLDPASNTVTTSESAIMQAVAMDEYNPNVPCPKDVNHYNDETNVFMALAKIPSPGGRPLHSLQHPRHGE